MVPGIINMYRLSSDIRCNQQQERSRKGQHMDLSHNNDVLDVMS